MLKSVNELYGRAVGCVYFLDFLCGIPLLSQGSNSLLVLLRIRHSIVQMLLKILITLFFSSLNCDGTSRYADCVHMLSDVVAGTRLEDNTIVAELQTQFDSSAATVQLWSYLANFILMSSNLLRISYVWHTCTRTSANSRHGRRAADENQIRTRLQTMMACARCAIRIVRPRTIVTLGRFCTGSLFKLSSWGATVGFPLPSFRFLVTHVKNTHPSTAALVVSQKI